jgi:GrpE
MSTSSLRVIAAGFAAIIAVLTGIVAGWVGAHAGTCTYQVQSAPTNQSPGQRLDEHSNSKAVPDRVVAQSGGGCDASFSVQTAAIGFVGAALAGGAAVALRFVRRREDDETATRAPAPAPAAPAANPGLQQRVEKLEAERGTLVQTCVYVRDRATSKALADTLGRALHDVGVSTVAPVGVRFDPAHHEAGGATPTTEPARAGTIAAVEVPGYVDRGVVLRAPVVTVYREEASK